MGGAESVPQEADGTDGEEDLELVKAKLNQKLEDVEKKMLAKEEMKSKQTHFQREVRRVLLPFNHPSFRKEAFPAFLLKQEITESLLHSASNEMIASLVQSFCPRLPVGPTWDVVMQLKKVRSVDEPTI